MTTTNIAIRTTAAAYPSFTTTPSLAAYAGGADFSVSATGLNPGFAAEFFLSLMTGPSASVSDHADVAPSVAGAASKTFNLPTQSGIAYKSMFVSTRDATWRDVVLRDFNAVAP